MLNFLHFSNFFEREHGCVGGKGAEGEGDREDLKQTPR